MEAMKGTSGTTTLTVFRIRADRSGSATRA